MTYWILYLIIGIIVVGLRARYEMSEFYVPWTKINKTKFVIATLLWPFFLTVLILIIIFRR